MKLIDADALIEEIKGLFMPDGFKLYILRTINRAKPFYEHERLKAEWLHDELYLDCRCPICNSTALEREDHPILSNFCPTCGADLRIKNCDNCRHSELKLTKEPCFSCIFGGCKENINSVDRWEPK